MGATPQQSAYDDMKAAQQRYNDVYNQYADLYGDEAKKKYTIDEGRASNLRNANFLGSESESELKNMASGYNNASSNLQKQMEERQRLVNEKSASDMAQNDAIGTAQANMKANRNAGLGSGASSLVGTSNSANQYSNTNLGMKQTLANQNASTQADYLGKLGYANNLQQQASNTAAGAGMLTAGAVLQGAGQGAATGLSLSDERFKQAIDNCEDVDLRQRTLDNVARFEELANRLRYLAQLKVPKGEK